MYKCPECRSTEELYVSVRTWAKLNQEEDNFETDTEDDGCPDHDHEWEEVSSMCCQSCDFSATAQHFNDAS